MYMQNNKALKQSNGELVLLYLLYVYEEEKKTCHGGLLTSSNVFWPN